MAQPDPAGDDGLSDDDVALLFDIGGSFPGKLDAGKARVLDRLITRGLVEPAGPQDAPEKYRLTTKAHEILSARGANLNES
jgi:hypothetical protein